MRPPHQTRAPPRRLYLARGDDDRSGTRTRLSTLLRRQLQSTFFVFFRCQCHGEARPSASPRLTVHRGLFEHLTLADLSMCLEHAQKQARLGGRLWGGSLTFFSIKIDTAAVVLLALSINAGGGRHATRSSSWWRTPSTMHGIKGEMRAASPYSFYPAPGASEGSWHLIFLPLPRITVNLPQGFCITAPFIPTSHARHLGCRTTGSAVVPKHKVSYCKRLKLKALSMLT